MTLPLRVVAAVIEQDGAYFCARRSLHKSNGGLWEFPGGKIEVNETPEKALQRELSEELHIQATIGEHIMTHVYKTSHMMIELLAYHVTRFQGHIHLVDHDKSYWLKPKELRTLNWAPADIPIVRHLSDAFSCHIHRAQ